VLVTCIYKGYLIAVGGGGGPGGGGGAVG